MNYLHQNSRETARHYLPASDADIDAMLQAAEMADLSQLYDHIPNELRMEGSIQVPVELDYDETMAYFETLASKNEKLTSFIGDGLPDFQQHEIVPDILGIRNLTTA